MQYILGQILQSTSHAAVDIGSHWDPLCQKTILF